MNTNITFVTGFFGSNIHEKADQIASQGNSCIVNLDELIQKADGRSVRRICMMMGEHEYRNKEYEAIKSITDNVSEYANFDNVVVACGDGVLYDDMSAELICMHDLIITGTNLSPDELWESALFHKDSVHAFMYFGDEEKKRRAFDELYMRQKALFNKYL